jgi:hypothetical protein
MSLPLIIGASVAGVVVLGILGGVTYKNRGGLREAYRNRRNFSRARQTVHQLNQERHIGKTIGRQGSQHSDVSDGVFGSDSPKGEALRDSLVGRESVARGRKTKKHKTKRHSRRHHR